MKYFLLSIAAALCLLPTNEARAQQKNSDGPVGIFASGTEYGQFMRTAKQVAAGNEELEAMIPMLNDIALDRPIGWTNQQYGGKGMTLDLLSNENVRAELEMVDHQYEQLQQMHEQVQIRAGEQLRALDFHDRENLIDQIRKIREQAEEDLNSLLLPHQLARLKQLQSQSRLQNRSFVDVITSDPLKTNLEISDQQSRELHETEREIEAELRKEIARLRSNARQKLLSKLTLTQREKVEEMFGDTFDFGDASVKKSSRTRRK